MTGDSGDVVAALAGWAWWEPAAAQLGGDPVTVDPTTTLAAHLEIVGNEPPVKCSCGWTTDLIGDEAKHAHAVHIMAVLAEEGWAIVKLPEAEEFPLRARLAAFARDCVHHGDMTPTAARMLNRILEDTQ